MKAFWLKQKQVKVALLSPPLFDIIQKLQLMQYDLEPKQEVQPWWLAWGVQLSLFREMIFCLDNSVELTINSINNKSSVKQTDKD